MYQSNSISTIDLLDDHSRSMSKIKGKTRQQVTEEGYNIFVEELDKEGWTMVSGVCDYGNTKSKVCVICHNGHDTQTTYNRFHSGHRCIQCRDSNMRKYNIETITREFEERGYKLLETIYVNNSTPMKCICKCGREITMMYGHFVRDIGGCKDCAGRWTISDTTEYMEEKGCTFKSVDSEFVLNSSHITYDCYCGTEDIVTLWRLFKTGTRCIDCNKEKCRQTCIEKYGYPNPAQSPVIKQIIINTNIKTFGVPHHMQLNECKEKGKTTNLMNHGGIHNLATPKIRMMVSSEESNNKRIQTNMERYDSPHFLGSKSYEDTMLERYNGKHPAHVPELFAKQLRNSFATKEYETITGKIFSIQGYENFALDAILSEGILEDDILTGTENVPMIKYDLRGEHIYYPDIYIVSKNMLIEVKSQYTYDRWKEKNDAKLLACKQQGYHIECWIYSAKGKKICTIAYTSTTRLYFHSA